MVVIFVSNVNGNTALDNKQHAYLMPNAWVCILRIIATFNGNTCTLLNPQKYCFYFAANNIASKA